MSKTQVCITVDVEFNIGGAFSDPDRNLPFAEQNVYCRVNGQSHGLGYILSVLEEYQLPATFFVEALNTYYFGPGPMSSVVNEIVQAGHDVQLHIHPVWATFRDRNWKATITDHPPNDSLVGRPAQEVDGLIARGLEQFGEWGVKRPVALRTGGLYVDMPVYESMARQGLNAASNVGLAIHRPKDPALQLYSGRHWLAEVLELPVLTYSQLAVAGHVHEKTLTITGSSWAEIETLLRNAGKAQVNPVVILTHPHEYVKSDHRPNRTNKERLVKLCRYLNDQRDRFETVTFSQGVQHWAQLESSNNARMSVPLSGAIKGIVQNKLNDYLSWY